MRDEPGLACAGPLSHAPPVRSGLLVLLMTAPALASGCGTPCKEIRADREAFMARATAAPGPHAEVALPFSTLDRLLSAQTARVERVSLELPFLGKLGASKKASLGLGEVRMRRARQGRVGASVGLELRSGGEVWAELVLDAEVEPRVDIQRGRLDVVISGDSLAKVSPRLGPKAQQQLARALKKELPEAARMVLPDRELGRIVDELGRWLVEGGYGLLRDNVLADVGEVGRFGMDLPDLPLSEVFVRSRSGALIVGLQTTLPVARALPRQGAREVQASDLITLRLSGWTVAEIANRAMAEGKLPDRYDDKGKAKPDGPFQGRIAWASEARPLRARLWKAPSEGGECVMATLAGTPEVTLKRQKLRIDVRDGVLRDVRGPALVEAFAWLAGLWRDAIELSVEIARQQRFEIGGRALHAAVVAVDLEGDDLTLGLRVSEEPLRIGGAGPVKE